MYVSKGRTGRLSLLSGDMGVAHVVGSMGVKRTSRLSW